MSRPPLHALEGFAAAARLGSLSRAAESLNLTTSALSHQMRTLEARLGQQLLVRKPRGVALTPDGGVSACRGLPSDGEVCGEAQDWLAAVSTIGADLFWGRQHVLRDDLIPAAPEGRQSADLSI